MIYHLQEIGMRYSVTLASITETSGTLLGYLRQALELVSPNLGVEIPAESTFPLRPGASQ